MAFLAEEEDKKKEEGQGETASQGQILSSPSAAPIQAGGSGQAAGASTGAPKATSSGSFTNLNAYLDANKGNDGAMGRAVGGTIQNSADKANEAGNTFKATAGTAISDNTVADTYGLTSTISGLAQEPAKPTSPPTTHFSKPAAPPKATTPAPTKAQPPTISADEFNRLYNASYSGPTRDTISTLDGYGQAAAAYGDVSNLAGMASGADSNMDSRGALLDRTYKQDGNQYRGGERTLDSFILGAGTEGLNEMKNIGDKYGNYETQLQGIMDYLGAQSDDAAATSAATQQAFRDAVGGAQGAVAGRLADAQLQAANANKSSDKAYQKLLKGDPAAWKNLDLRQFAPDSGYSNSDILQILKNSKVDLGSVLEQSGGQTMADFANDTDEANFNQLMSLIGGAGGDATSKFGKNDFKTGTARTPQFKKSAKQIVADAVAAAAAERAKAQSAGDAFGQAYSGVPLSSYGSNVLNSGLGGMVAGNAEQSELDQFLYGSGRNDTGKGDLHGRGK